MSAVRCLAMIRAWSAVRQFRAGPGKTISGPPGCVREVNCSCAASLTRTNLSQRPPHPRLEGRGSTWRLSCAASVTTRGTARRRRCLEGGGLWLQRQRKGRGVCRRLGACAARAPRPAHAPLLGPFSTFTTVAAHLKGRPLPVVPMHRSASRSSTSLLLVRFITNTSKRSRP